MNLHWKKLRTQIQALCQLKKGGANIPYPICVQAALHAMQVSNIVTIQILLFVYRNTGTKYFFLFPSLLTEVFVTGAVQLSLTRNRKRGRPRKRNAIFEEGMASPLFSALQKVESNTCVYFKR